MMFSRRQLLHSLAVWTATLPLSGCWLRNYGWNQKLTLEVETPSGLRTASAVTRVDVKVGRAPLSGDDKSFKLKGEATVLEVKPGKYLFALIGEDTKWLAYKAWKINLTKGSTDDDYRTLSELREKKEISGALAPMLVTFKNINDPASVVQVDQFKLGEQFGAGVSLKSITVEITDEPMTEGEVEKVLSIQFFKRWGTMNKEAVSRMPGFKDPYFKTLQANLSRNSFIWKRDQ